MPTGGARRSAGSFRPDLNSCGAKKQKQKRNNPLKLDRQGSGPVPTGPLKLFLTNSIKNRNESDENIKLKLETRELKAARGVWFISAIKTEKYKIIIY